MFLKTLYGYRYNWVSYNKLGITYIILKEKISIHLAVTAQEHAPSPSSPALQHRCTAAPEASPQSPVPARDTSGARRRCPGRGGAEGRRRRVPSARASFRLDKTSRAQGPEVGAPRRRLKRLLSSLPVPPPLPEPFSQRGEQSAKRGRSLPPSEWAPSRHLPASGGLGSPAPSISRRESAAPSPQSTSRAPRTATTTAPPRPPVLLTPPLRSSPCWAAATAAVAAATRSPKARAWRSAMLCAPRTWALEREGARQVEGWREDERTE